MLFRNQRLQRAGRLLHSSPTAGEVMVVTVGVEEVVNQHVEMVVIAAQK